MMQCLQTAATKASDTTWYVRLESAFERQVHTVVLLILEYNQHDNDQLETLLAGRFVTV